MPARRHLSLGAVCLVTLAAALSFGAGAARAGVAVGPHVRALYASKLLWATIDVCNARDQPNTLGVRGSMPGDGNRRDRMYMAFRLQYLEAASRRWVDLAGAAKPPFVAVGAGSSARQGGRSFQLVPVAGRPAFTLRGVVEFQWRLGRTVIAATSRPTSAPHPSLAGADPKGYSASSCLIG